jgi:hypothetical protein
VWVRAAGHCELCGADLTRDVRVGNLRAWGEAAHILPASPMGPRAEPGHSDSQARQRTNDPDNLMLLCPNCHEQIDKDEHGYPKDDLTQLHRAQIDRITLIAQAPAHMRAVPLIVLSQHFATLNKLPDHELLQAMLAEGLYATCKPVRLDIPPPLSSGKRDHAYWRTVSDSVHHKLSVHLNRSDAGSADLLAVAGLADIPTLLMLGQVIGDRMPRRLFSPNRGSGLRWPEPTAPAPEFHFDAAPGGPGPLALVVSLSAIVPRRDVEAALIGARIAEFSIDIPSVSMVRSRHVIDGFRTALQQRLSELEAQECGAIHLFMAIPAALAIEFGAMLTMQHRHTYCVYDRSESGTFELMLRLDHAQKLFRP